ncbi:MAG: 4,5-DOPA dioxygenase extradiol [Methylococcales bacterium]|nr:4,5-DOPA dioxygenase extradiol [Methylococcales bacterium]
MNQNEKDELTNTLNSTEPMPVLFIGHGSPMNAIEDNEFTKAWREVAKILPKPRAILCISAHWETRGTQVTAMEKPRTIHDFGGFPRALNEVQYSAPGSPWLAQEVKDTMKKIKVGLDQHWGFDHGCWIILMQMFPAADIPVIQLSLDYTRQAPEHYALAKELAPLRQKGILILGSGNIVHNLSRLVVTGNDSGDLNKPFELDWAVEANELFKRLINENRHPELAHYQSLGNAARLAVPTPEHFLPMLYVLALKQENETVIYFNDQAVGASLTMTSLIIDAGLKNAQYAKQMSSAVS